MLVQMSRAGPNQPKITHLLSSSGLNNLQGLLPFKKNNSTKAKDIKNAVRKEVILTRTVISETKPLNTKY